MGMADFYIKINFNKNKEQDINVIFEKLVINNLYSTIIETNNELSIISIEGKFDNILPTLILVFDILYEYKSDIITIESYGIKEKFNFENVEDFIYFIFKTNKKQPILSQSISCFYYDIKSYHSSISRTISCACISGSALYIGSMFSPFFTLLR